VVSADEQRDAPVDVPRWTGLAHDVLVAEGVIGDAELSLSFVDEDTIAGLNRRYLHADGPTDVLAFPIDDLGRVTQGLDGDTAPPPGPLLLGDVVVCPAMAERQAPQLAGGYEDELALLVVHGVLHLLGYDHADAGEAEAMQRRERELLDRFHGR